MPARSEEDVARANEEVARATIAFYNLYASIEAMLTEEEKKDFTPAVLAHYVEKFERNRFKGEGLAHLGGTDTQPAA